MVELRAETSASVYVSETQHILRYVCVWAALVQDVLPNFAILSLLFTYLGTKAICHINRCH